MPTNGNSNSGASMELPRYASHKQVWALKIQAIATNPDGSGVMVPEDERYAAINLEAEYMSKHQPKIGGYYIQYKDGYKSFSPAEPFEEGYTLITQ